MYLELTFLLLFLVMAMVLYFKVADKLSIIDKANHRSSHAIPTVRGGGIVFIFSLLVWFFVYSFSYPFFIVGAVLIALISFADDVKARPPLLRFGIHLLAVLLLCYAVDVFHEAWWMVVLILIIGIGTINAFNFMDGINGITGVYALVNLITFYLINRYVVSFTSESMIVYVGISVLVFLFFNFRKQARCFAGDVGSITLAFVQIFLCLQLILATGNYGWVLLFLVYGADSVITIFYRLMRRENIFEPHRTHVYQYLANELKIDHRLVSIIYGAMQAGVNVLLVLHLRTSSWIAWIVLLALGTGMLITRKLVASSVRREID